MNRGIAVVILGWSCLLAWLPAFSQTTVTLSPAGAVWKYLDNRADLGTAWQAFSYNDSTWASGPAQLGYGDGDEATIIYGGPSNNRIATTYFRRAFTVAPGQSFASLVVRLVRDDGGIVYLNGVEVFRSNMPSGAVNYLTFASSRVDVPAESQFFTTTVGSSLLLAGTNVLAVEVHQFDSGSSDVSFDLELNGVTGPPTLPVILSQPASAAVSAGGTASFSVATGGNGPFAYQWRKNGALLTGGGRILGVSSPALTLTDLESADAAFYTVAVSSSSGSITSSVATLTVTPLPTDVFDDFEPGIDLTQWGAFGSTVRATNYGGSVSPPNSLWFGGDGDRFAVTRPINTTLGGVISFYLRLSDGTGGNPNWENVDIPGEGVVFEYTVDRGSNWTRVATYDMPIYNAWTLTQMFIPPGARAARTQFRWRQLSNSGSPNDHWAIDDVEILSQDLPPVILGEPADQTVLQGSDARFVVDSGGAEPLIYQWTFNGMEIPGAIGPVLNVHAVATNATGIYQLRIHNPLGDAVSRGARLTVVDLSQDVFRITALGTNDAAVVDHPEVGPARGGVAVSHQRYFYTGNNGTACFDLADLGHGVTNSVISGNIISDLRSGKVYTLASATAPLSTGGGVVTRLIEVDGVTGQLLGNSIPLTAPVVVSSYYYGDIGFFSGVGRAAVFNGTNAYSIFLPSGLVIDHGRQGQLTHTYDAWAYWGVVEFFDGATWLTRVTDYQTISRTRLSDGYTAGVASFADIRGMSEFTVAPERNRWYFHFQSQSQFGSGTELSGYAGAGFSFQQDTQAVRIVGQPRGKTAVVGTTAELQVSALGYPVEYQWLRNGAPLPGETGFRLSLSNLKLSDAGVYSVIVSNLLGAQTSTGAILRVVPAVSVSVFDDPNYVDTYGGTYSESDCVQSSLQALGHNVSAVTNVASALTPGRVLLFPSLAFGNPAPALDAATRAALQSFVFDGGLIVVQGGGSTVQFVNDIFGLSCIGTYAGSSSSLLTGQAAGTAFSEGPPVLPYNSTTYGLTANSLPGGARNIYTTNGLSSVAILRLGSGRVIFLGWNWENGAPLGNQDNGWLEVLNNALLETAPLVAVPPAIAVQPEDRPTVAGIDASLRVVAYGSGPLTYQWLREGIPIFGATNSTLRVPAPTPAAAGNFAVVVTNPFGVSTSRTARVTIRISRGLAGFYFDYFFYTDPYPAPELSILQAGFTPVRITNITSFDFRPLSVLLLDATYFGETSVELQNRVPAIAGWVAGGGRLIVHDITGNSIGSGTGIPSPLLIGAGNTLVSQSYNSQVDVSPPGGTLVTAGPYGTISDASLDTAASISLTSIDGATLAPGMTPILQRDSAPTQYVAISYGLGSGVVFYSTIYMNYLLQNSFEVSPVLRDVYLPNAIEYVLAYTPSGPPLLVQSPRATGVLLGSLVTLNVFASGLPALRYQWRFNGVEIPGATNSALVLSNVSASVAGVYNVRVTNPLGATNSADAILSVIDAKPFRIVSLGTAGSQVVDHDALTSDDRGGIAVSRDSVFITGDATTARFAAANLGGGTALPIQYDALVGNLRTETVYSLAQSNSLISYGGGLVDNLIALDGSTGALTTNRIWLSTPILMRPNGDGGIFSGYDAAVLHDGNRAYRIDLVTGLVMDLGMMAAPLHQRSESWAYWGVAEYFAGAMWLVAVRDSQTITRTRVPDGFTTNLATFSNLGDMASFTFSTSRDRWYFHYEGSAQFGGSSETLGYATASWDKPPQISGLGDIVMNEDASQAGVPFSVSDDQTPAANLLVTARSSNTNLFSNAGLALAGSGAVRTLALTPLPNRFGTSVVTVAVTDSIGATTNRSIVVGVLPVNDAPSFTAGPDITVLEDAGSQSFPAWASQISPGPFESGQQITFVLNNSVPALFSTPPAISASGELTFVSAADVFGIATISVQLLDDGGIANGGQNASALQTFTIRVLPANDPPTAHGQMVTTAEDTPISIALTGADVESDALSYIVVTPPAHGALGGGGATRIYTPAPDYHGPDSFTFKVNDGEYDSPLATVTLLVSSVNDAPTAQSLALTNREDATWVLTLAGSDVDGDSLTYEVLSSPTNGTLTPFIPLGGMFLYRPNPDFFGADSFTFRVHDGVTNSLPATVTIEILAVNDAPGFSKGPDVVVEEDSGPQTFPGWAAGISPGPVNESTQAVQFLVNATAPNLFSAAPAIAPDGTLTFTPAPNANGTAEIRVQLEDDGGVEDGGVSRSSLQTFRITVNPVNDAPVAQPATLTVSEDPPGGGIHFFLRALDVDGDAVTFVIVTPSLHGTVTPGTPPATTVGIDGIARALAQFVYSPAPEYSGPDSFVYKVNDGRVDSASVTVSIRVDPVNDPPVAVPRVLNSTQFGSGSTNPIVITRNNSNGPVILDASLSHDAEGDPIRFAWFADGAFAPFATNVLTTNLFSVGSHLVLLLADDGQDAGFATIRVEVLSPALALEELVRLVEGSRLPRNRIRPLEASLKAAMASFDRDSFNSGVNQLRAFQSKVRAQVSSIDPVLATTLDNLIRSILGSMGVN